MSDTVLEAQKNLVTPVLESCIICKTQFCDTCGLCHTDGCSMYSKAVSSKAQMVALGLVDARTQKARGYTVIARELNVPKPFWVISESNEIETAVRGLTIPATGLFVRPCPVRPRHGFVESRLVNASLTPSNTDGIIAELHGVLEEAKKADPDAELLLVPCVNATHNLILTPSRMAIGKGNDGATAGHQSTVFPLTGTAFPDLPASVIKQAAVAESEDPYVEVVIRDGYQNLYTGYANPTAVVYFTQLRAGVKIPAAVDLDFIPSEFTVDKVIEASGDLLEWERQVKEEIKPGTAVFHLGGTLISHYGVHCIFHNIPILTTRKPVIGETLVPTKRPDLPTPEAVIYGLGLAASDKYIGLLLNNFHGVSVDGSWPASMYCNEAVALLLVAAHNAAALAGDHGKWLGIATVLMMRLGMAASHGEARHKKVDGLDTASHSRALVYKKALNDFFNARMTVGCAQWRFKNLSWSASYGGLAWASCTAAIIRLDQSARTLIKEPNDANVAALVTALHNAINQAHNGGWWLNKFVSGKTIFDEAAVQRMAALCAAAPAILEVANLQPDMSEVRLTFERWAGEPDIAIEKGIVPPKKEIVFDPVVQPTSFPATPAEPAIVGPEVASEVQVEGASAIPFDERCGDLHCMTCYPKPDDGPEKEIVLPKAKLKSIPTEQGNGNKNDYGLPVDLFIVSAQGYHDGSTMHVQYKAKGIGGYYSFNISIGQQSTIATEKALSLSKLSSYAHGSSSKYFPLDPYKTDAGAWHVKQDELSIDVEVPVSKKKKGG